jgi:hypothetical protein
MNFFTVLLLAVMLGFIVAAPIFPQIPEGYKADVYDCMFFST